MARHHPIRQHNRGCCRRRASRRRGDEGAPTTVACLLPLPERPQKATPDSNTLRVMEHGGRRRTWLAVGALGVMGIVVGMSLRTGACFDERCTAQLAWWLILPSVALTGYSLHRAFAQPRQRRVPQVQPSDVLTQLLCLRDGLRLSALATVPPLANNTRLAGSLSASAEERARLAALIEQLWETWMLTAGTQPPSESAQWREVQQCKVRLDSEHVIGRWMAEQFVALLHRVMDQQVTSPKAVPEFLAESAVSRAVEHGLERVLVIPVSHDYWDWRPESHLLVVAESTRNNTSTYPAILAATARP